MNHHLFKFLGTHTLFFACHRLKYIAYEFESFKVSKDKVFDLLILVIDEKNQWLTF